MRTVIVGLLLVLAVPFAFAAEPASTNLETSTAIGRATIEVNGTPTRFTSSQGFNIRRASLKDRFGRTVGRSNLICVMVSAAERDCRGTYTFPRGRIVVAGIVQADGYVLAVVGGTGLYDNARGAMRVSPSGAQENHRVFFQLVG